MKKKDVFKTVGTAYQGLMLRRINEFYKGCCMIDVSSLSSSPPKSSETGGKGLKAEALGLSTGGALPAFFVPSRGREGKRCHDCKKRFIAEALLRMTGEFTGDGAQAKNRKRKPRSHFIIYLPGSRTHGTTVMVHGNSPLKESKAAQSQIPCLPSPPFLAAHGRPSGSTCSLDPFTAPGAQRQRLINPKVTSFVSLCLCGGCV